MLVKYNFQIFYIKGLENGRADVLNRKFKYYKNKKHVFYVILTVEKLGLKYNKPQLVVIVRLKISN